MPLCRSSLSLTYLPLDVANDAVIRAVGGPDAKAGALQDVVMKVKNIRKGVD